jgi:hypothetical protein
MAVAMVGIEGVIMKTNRTQLGLGAATIVLSLLCAFGASSLTVQGQGRNDRGRYDNRNRNRNNDGYGNYGGSFQLRQTALNAGYNEGTKDGRKDRDKGRGYDFRNQKTYQQATKDYSSRLGDRELYRRYFREAYENGYNEQLNPQDRIYTNGTLSIQKTFLIYWACEPRLIRSFS